MMYQTIGDRIEVIGVYQQSGQPAHFVPKKFKWRGNVYPISEITLVSDVKDGGVRQRLYSVMAGGNVYRLMFNRDDEVWELAEVWYEG